MKNISKMIFGATCAFMLAGCFGLDLSGDGDNGSSNLKEEYAPGETFVFDDFEITIGANYSIVKVENSFDEDYKKPVVRIPMTVKNVGPDSGSFNYFYYKVFEPGGTETITYSFLWSDSIEAAGDLATGGSYTKYIYAKYTVDGEYTVKFDGYSHGKTKVKLNVVGGEEVLPQKTTFELGETFKYENFEFTFSKSYTFVKNTNQFAEEYNRDVIKIPVTVKNIGTSTDSTYMYIYKMFNPRGNEVKSENLYFDNYLEGCSEELMPGASMTKYLYYLYDGNGAYTIEMYELVKQHVKINVNVVLK